MIQSELTRSSIPARVPWVFAPWGSRMDSALSMISFEERERCRGIKSSEFSMASESRPREWVSEAGTGRNG